MSEVPAESYEYAGKLLKGNLERKKIEEKIKIQKEVNEQRLAGAQLHDSAYGKGETKNDMFLYILSSYSLATAFFLLWTPNTMALSFAKSSCVDNPVLLASVTPVENFSTMNRSYMSALASSPS